MDEKEAEARPVMGTIFLVLELTVIFFIKERVPAEPWVLTNPTFLLAIFKECGCNGDHKIIQLTEPQVLLAIVGVYFILLTLNYRHGSTKDWCT